MAPMLGVTFKLAESNPVYGVSLLLAYGVGHCSGASDVGGLSDQAAR
jgi:cytochrome c-type biogenesis protein